MNAPDPTEAQKAISQTGEVAQLMQALGQRAKVASAQTARAPAAIKNRALLNLAALLRQNLASLQAANQLDLQRATAAGLAAPLVDRLKLNEKIIDTVAQGCEQLAAMPDVIGEIIGMKQQPSGIRVGQMRVPIGVFGMIYESRPNVTIEAASLAIKSGNACILRGGSEAIESNKALAALVQQALVEAGLPADAVQLVPTTDREAVGQLITMPQFVDVIIPRGGKGLIERVSRDAKVPVIKHLDGNCHVRLNRLRAAAQNAGIAALDGQRSGFNRHVRPTFVNHAENANRHPHLANADAAGLLLHANDLADHVRHGGELLAAQRDGFKLFRAELEPLKQRSGQSGGGGAVKIALVGRLQGFQALPQQGGQTRERSVFDSC